MPNGKLCGNGYTFVDTRDEKQEEYATVQIGEQCWMAENLRYTGNGCESNSWTSSTYNACDTHNTDWGEEVLYQWEAAMNACPLGWHLPTHDELTTLERAICTSGTCATDFPYDEETEGYRGTDEGYKLKSTANWNNDGTGDNSSGFNVLPAGTRSNLGVLVNVGSHGLWWSSSPDGIMDAWRRYLYYDYSTIGRISGTQAGGYSVRCLAGT